MRIFDQQWLKAGVAKSMLLEARKGVLDQSRHDLGSARHRAYLKQCTAYHHGTGARIILTRDTGHHTSGWWKNPDYERCLHLSLSFLDPATAEPIEHQHDIAAEWCDLFFPGITNLIWAEPPYSEQGKQADTWHYRVFYSSGWAAPILPRGEVYSKEFTEAGWLSWSDRAELLAKEAEREGGGA